MATIHTNSMDYYSHSHSHPKNLTRSPSIHSTSPSSSSHESIEQQSPKPKHKKSSSFSKFFSTKEPSIAAFQQLALQQQKELEKKGQKVPFGVPQARLPDSVKEDYKSAKHRAKERARLHDQAKEQMKLQEEDVRRKPSVSADDGGSRRPSCSAVQKSPEKANSRVRRLPSLDEVAEIPSIESVARLPPSPPVSGHSRSSSGRATGLLTGEKRREALPWE